MSGFRYRNKMAKPNPGPNCIDFNIDHVPVGRSTASVAIDYCRKRWGEGQLQASPSPDHTYRWIIDKNFRAPI